MTEEREIELLKRRVKLLEKMLLAKTSGEFMREVVVDARKDSFGHYKPGSLIGAIAKHLSRLTQHERVKIKKVVTKTGKSSTFGSIKTTINKIAQFEDAVYRINHFKDCLLITRVA